MEAFIRSKYERKQYLKKDGLPPNKATSAASATKETKSTDKVKNFLNLGAGIDDFKLTVSRGAVEPDLVKLNSV